MSTRLTSSAGHNQLHHMDSLSNDLVARILAITIDTDIYSALTTTTVSLWWMTIACYVLKQKVTQRCISMRHSIPPGPDIRNLYRTWKYLELKSRLDTRAPDCPNLSLMQKQTQIEMLEFVATMHTKNNTLLSTIPHRHGKSTIILKIAVSYMQSHVGDAIIIWCDSRRHRDILKRRIETMITVECLDDHDIVILSLSHECGKQSFACICPVMYRAVCLSGLHIYDTSGPFEVKYVASAHV